MQSIDTSHTYKTDIHSLFKSIIYTRAINGYPDTILKK